MGIAGPLTTLMHDDAKQLDGGVPPGQRLASRWARKTHQWRRGVCFLASLDEAGLEPWHLLCKGDPDAS
jgi:hypothetical protein